MCKSSTSSEIETAPHEVVNEDKKSLHDAAMEGATELTALLIARGANIEKKNNSGKTPLYWTTMTTLLFIWI